MANYLNTDKVKVFPFGKGRVTDPYCKTLNEQNITNLVRMLTDQKSYIVQEGTNFIDFVIYGYYFNVEKDALKDLRDALAEDLEQTFALYAYIQLQKQSPAYILGGDYITQIASGEGTELSPYILSDGEYRIELQGTETYYYKSAKTVTILNNDNIEMTVDTDKGNVKKVDNTIIITPITPNELSFQVKLSDGVTSSILAISAGNSKFQGLCFATEAPENDPNNDTVYYSIKLLDENGNIPPDSFLKYSYDTKSLPLRIISGGTSANL